ncbi:hypothetical protein FACS1894164_03960 [Spirochaetia bacterium]|nr:hypothetical protein FACS1894164_03960 [Spirochaetia bacterium]
MRDITLSIQDITPENRENKLVKAVREVSRQLNVPIIVEEQHKQEPYEYLSQQEVADKWNRYFEIVTRQVYEAVSQALDFPSVKLKKARGNDPVIWKGKLIYSPETGEPIHHKDFDALIASIEKFLNRNTAGLGKRVILSAVTIGKLLDRMIQEQGTPAMARKHLNDVTYKGRDFDWISQDYKNLESVLGHKLDRHEMGNYQVAEEYVAQKVTRVTENVRNDIKETILYGILERRTKSQVALDLFNRLGSENKDWRRVVETEMNNTSNLAGIKEELHYTEPNEKVYFKRIELTRSCPKCARLNGTIALWSDHRLPNEAIDDDFAKVAIWEGKDSTSGVPVGTVHPNCRGHWIRTFKPRKTVK